MSTLETLASPTLQPSLRAQKKARTREALHEAAYRLVTESGLAAVTIDEICAEAQVSPRTFFNYYPSKAAAALGLPDFRLDDEQRASFLAGTRNVVRDLCDLLATAFDGSSMRPDKTAMRELLHSQPELQPELHSWLAGSRRALADLVEQRTTPERARSAMALVMAAVGDAARRDDAPGTSGEHLWQAVQDMVAVATA